MMVQAREVDGHLVGSIGVRDAAHICHLELNPALTQGCNAKSPDSRFFAIKLTPGSSLAIGHEGSHSLYGTTYIQKASLD